MAKRPKPKRPKKPKPYLLPKLRVPRGAVVHFNGAWQTSFENDQNLKG